MSSEGRSETDPIRNAAASADLAGNVNDDFGVNRAAAIGLWITAFGIFPLAIAAVGPFVSNGAQFSRDQFIILGAMGAGYLGLSAFLFLIVYLLYRADRALLRARLELINVVNDQHPLRNVVNQFDFTVETGTVTSSLIVNECRRAITSGKILEPQQEQQFLFTFLSAVKQIFDYYTGHKCSVCIKAFDNGKIFTLWRDRNSYSERSSVDKLEGLRSYDPWANTAFRDILDDGRPDTAFACNDLKTLASQGLYQNTNPHWARYYNACIVVPIRAPEGDIRKNLFGFLCVDSLRGRFSDTIALSTLRTLANLFYFYILIKNSVLSPTPPEAPKPAETEIAHV